MKWKYPSKGQMPPEGCGWCLLIAENFKYYIATYIPNAHEWRCQDYRWKDDGIPASALSIRLEENQVHSWVEIAEIKNNIELDENGEEYPMETYKNCKLKIADFTESEAQFTFEYGGTITAECRTTPRTYEMMGYMRDLKPVDITIEDGVIKDVKEHKD